MRWGSLRLQLISVNIWLLSGSEMKTDTSVMVTTNWRFNLNIEKKNYRCNLSIQATVFAHQLKEFMRQFSKLKQKRFVFDMLKVHLHCQARWWSVNDRGWTMYPGRHWLKNLKHIGSTAEKKKRNDAKARVATWRQQVKIQTWTFGFHGDQLAPFFKR